MPLYGMKLKLGLGSTIAILDPLSTLYRFSLTQRQVNYNYLGIV